MSEYQRKTFPVTVQLVHSPGLPKGLIMFLVTENNTLLSRSWGEFLPKSFTRSLDSINLPPGQTKLVRGKYLVSMVQQNALYRDTHTALQTALRIAEKCKISHIYLLLDTGFEEVINGHNMVASRPIVLSLTVLKV